MQHIHIVHRVSGIALLILSAGAHALGLGEIKVTSYLGQPFYAEVPLRSAGGLTVEETQLSADIPDYSEHAALGLDAAILVRDLRVEVVAFPADLAHLKLTTEQPVLEPVLNFIVRTSSDAGERVREYTVLLDPPSQNLYNTRSPSPVDSIEQPTLISPLDPQPGSVAPSTPAPVSTYEAPRVVPTQPTVALAPITSERYGPVAAGDTLYSIARRVRLAEPQPLPAIVQRLFRNNPQAFVGGNMDRLLEGAMLELVEREPARSTPFDTATTRTETELTVPAEPVTGPNAVAPASESPPVAVALPENAVDTPAVREMEEKVDQAKWTLHAEQKQHTVLSSRLAELEARLAALRERSKELEREEQQIADKLEGLAQSTAPIQPQATAETPVTSAASVEAPAPSAVMPPQPPSERHPKSDADAWMQKLLHAELNTTWMSLVAVLLATLAAVALRVRRKRRARSAAAATDEGTQVSQDDAELPQDTHVSFLDDHALSDDTLTPGALEDAITDDTVGDATTLDGFTAHTMDDELVFEDPGMVDDETETVAVEGKMDDELVFEDPGMVDDETETAAVEGKVIETTTAKAQRLANEAGLYMAYAQYDRAQQNIEEAIELDPRDEFKVVLLTIYDALGQREDAKSLTEELLARRESLGDDLWVQVEDITRKCA